jgi:hypothetical protein
MNNDLTANLISTVVGTKLQGRGAIYMAQNTRFTAQVKAGDTTWKHGGEVVVKGDALLLVPTRGATARSYD